MIIKYVGDLVQDTRTPEPYQVKPTIRIPPKEICHQWLDFNVSELLGSGHRTSRTLEPLISSCSKPAGSRTFDSIFMIYSHL